MRLTRLVAIAAVAGSIGLAFAADETVAQISEQQPAEFPPASYKGKQYVDSQGCVFIRAGIDGGVSWVPRVTRDRKTVCGFKPSLASPAQAVAPSAPAPVEIVVADPAPVPTPAPRRAKVVPVSPVVYRSVPKPKPKPKPRVVKAVPAVAKPSPVPVTLASGCLAPTPMSGQYLQTDDVGCGAQPQAIAPRHIVSARGDRYVDVTSTTRIVPKHVAENRVNTRNIAVPKGYKPVWNDGRLNPRRAEQNLAGRAQMALTWTNTLPRRLINPVTGRDVTASVPLIYPYTSVAQQRVEVGEVEIVQRNGETVKRIIRHSGTASVTRQPVYSTRSEPAKPVVKPSKALSGERYVQVATFRVSGNAQRAAQQIAAMGMRARINKYRKGGQVYMAVQAGPFVESGKLTRAVKRLRGAGYSDAFVR